MTPYFQNDHVRLFHGDCLEVLPSIEAADMVLADPPYEMTANNWDSVIPLDPLWVELKRLVKGDGAIVMTAAQPFTSALIMSNLPMFRYCWVWEKNKASGFLNCKIMPLRAHEDIVVFGQKVPAYYPQMSTGHAPGNYARRVVESENYGNQRETEYGGSTERYPRSVQAFNVVDNISKERRHPTQKPVALLEYLILTYTNEGDTVVDFSMGAGSTGLACVKTNRRFVGIEINEAYCEAAVERLGAGIQAELCLG